MIDIYIVKYIFDSLYNAGVKHSLIVYSLNVYTLYNGKICVTGFLHQGSANGIGTIFSLQIIEVFILFSKVSHCDLVMLNL